jgi:uncharacterized MnhB-related membrane protein
MTTGTTAVQFAALMLVAAGAVIVVRQRTPIDIAFVSGGYGLLLAVLFLTFHAPDVALSQIVVGSFAIPTLVLVTIARGNDGGKTDQHRDDEP